MTTVTKAIIKKPGSLRVVGGDRPLDKFKERESAELVIALSGPVGCGIDSVLDATAEVLEELGYVVKRVKLSEFIEEALKGRLVTLEKEYDQSRAGRYDRLQTAGNLLRGKYKAGDILAEYAVKRVAQIRTEEIPATMDLEAHVPKRRAFLIDQLKHPEEVNLLRVVYRNIFYLVGVLSVHGRRHKRLLEDGLTGEEAARVMDRDRKEPDDYGQQLDKTLKLADFFIRNDKPNVDQLKSQLRRFAGLMHGENGITPTRHEYGMYVAYAAGLGSACLSRQVGASILDEAGNVIATGKNDVPKFDGGLYSAESGSDDARCVFLEGRKCWNDYHKRKVVEQIEGILLKGLDQKGVSPEELQKLVDDVYENTRIKYLIEFSRSIHAEMDAIVSVARKGTGSVARGTLYTTTFPCHSCARQIVAAGIRRVYYIEPYEKSLAFELHSDSIALEPVDSGGDSSAAHSKGRVEFIHFEGVAPRQYINMFLPKAERKDKGVALMRSAAESAKAVPEYLDDYRAFESKVVEHLQEITSSQEGGGAAA